MVKGVVEEAEGGGMEEEDIAMVDEEIVATATTTLVSFERRTLMREVGRLWKESESVPYPHEYFGDEPGLCIDGWMERGGRMRVVSDMIRVAAQFQRVWVSRDFFGLTNR